MKRFSFIMALCMCCIFVNAQADQGKKPDNYQLVEKPFFTDQEALEYYNQRLKVNPKDGEAHAWIARICLDHGDYDKALTAANAAIKYLPKEDRESLDLAYSSRALIYYDMEKYKLSEADSRKLLTSSDSQYVQMGYINIGCIQDTREQFDEAIDTYTKLINLYPDYAQVYKYRASTFFNMQKYEEMATDLIKALEVDYDDAFYMLTILDDEKAIQLMVTKLQEQTLQFPNNAKWWLCYGVALELDKQYTKAIEIYQKSNQLKHSNYVDKRIGDCYVKMGGLQQSLEHYTFLIARNSTNYSNYYYRSRVYEDLGDLPNAIKDMTKFIELQPKNYFGYYRRGWYEHLNNECERAIEDLQRSIRIFSKYTYSYDAMARCYIKLGDSIKARQTYEKLLTIRPTHMDENAAYAYHYLGQDDKAIEWVEETLQKNPTSVYGAACVYSLVGDTTKALYYLEQSFIQTGYVRINHINIDEDLNNIRHLDSYKALVNKYCQKMLERRSAHR